MGDLDCLAVEGIVLAICRATDRGFWKSGDSEEEGLSFVVLVPAFVSPNANGDATPTMKATKQITNLIARDL
jgi:hypothetical protein